MTSAGSAQARPILLGVQHRHNSIKTALLGFKWEMGPGLVDGKPLRG